MKKNLLAAILVFFFTFIVLLVLSDVSHKEQNQHDDQHYVVKD
jgi:hypothetical protein